MLLKVPFAEYEFRLQAIDPVSLPAFADPLWRSVFGLALRQLSCHEGKSNCVGCRSQNQCDYASLLQPLGLPGKAQGITAKMPEVSGPLVFHSQVTTFSPRLRPGDIFSARIVLVGSGNDHLPAVIRAMTLAGQLGLGKKRAKFRLMEVHQTGPNLLPRIIMTNSTIHTHGAPDLPAIPEAPKVIRCTFVTPYLLPDNTKVHEGFDHLRFIMQAVRRITSLQNVHTDNSIDIDFLTLKNIAAKSHAPDTGLTLDADYSYSGDKKRFFAVRGAFILDLSASSELWPWLWQVQWLHVPKLAGKGFGRYEIAVVEE